MLRAYHGYGNPGYGELPNLPGYVTSEELDRQLAAAKEQWAQKRLLLAAGAGVAGFLLGRWLR